MNRRILQLAVPNIISNLTVPLLGAVDTALVGHLENVEYLGAIAVGSMIFNFLFWGFGFLRMGTTGLTAQSYGARDDKETGLILARALGVAAAGAILLMLLKNPIADLSFWIVEASSGVEDYTRIYYNIRIFSAPATLGLYALNGWFLGMQNARYPMYITIFLNSLNIALDFSFIYGFGMHVNGVAWGTLIARYAGVMLAVGLLFYRYSDVITNIDFSNYLDLEPIQKFFSVNRDIFIRTLCLIFTFSFFTAKSASFGDIILAANSILLQMWMIVSYGIDGFAFAAESLVGRFFGEKDDNAMQEAVKKTLLWGAGIGISASLVYALFDEPILRIFTDKTNVITTALAVFGWTIAGPTVSSFSYIWDGIFIGATKTAALRNSMLIATLLVFLPAYFFTAGWLGNHAIWLAMTLFMIARGLTLTAFAPSYIFNSLKRKKDCLCEKC